MKPRTRLLAAALLGLALLSIRESAADATLPGALPGAHFPEAWHLSRGEGVTVAVLASEGSPWLELVKRAAPEARVLALDPDTTSGTEAQHDRALARTLDSAHTQGARVILVPETRRRLLATSTAAIARVTSAGVLVVAPAGDEGLAHERLPAALPTVVSVAALDARGALEPASNLGSRTIVAARGRDSHEAAALVAGAAALAFGYDREITTRELTAALAGGARVDAREGFVGPATLDARALLERLRPRSRAFALEDARVLPGLVPAGERATARVTVLACGRNPARGSVAVAVPGSAPLTLPFGPLEPGERAVLEGELVPHAGSFAPVRSRDGGLVPGAPLEATFRSGPCETRARFLAVPGDQRPPGLRLVRVEAAVGLRLEVVVENTSVVPEASGLVRLVLGKDTLGEASVPELAPGRRARIALVGRVPSGTASPVDARLEVVRRPKGFHESVESSVPVRLDTLGAPAPRRRARPEGAGRAGHEKRSPTCQLSDRAAPLEKVLTARAGEACHAEERPVGLRAFAAAALPRG